MLVEFVLPKAAPASLQLLDVTGRRLADREVGSYGAGVHTVDLADDGRFAAGVYFIRLVQDSAVRTLRVTVMR